MSSVWRNIIFLIVISLCALLLRTYDIAKNPPALSWDEVSIGYNAYSILRTGRDEHGKFLPLDTFVAYGDYKPPLAIYLTIPSILVFGLNEFGVRLPSALFGTATVLATYFLVGELFFRKKNLKNTGLSGNLFRYFPITAAAVLAVSPWHINLSRAGFEANIALFFVVFGTWLILSTRWHPKRWVIAWLPFVAGIYTFNSTRYFVPFLSIGLLLYLGASVRRQWKFVLLGCAVAIVAMLPIITHLLSPEARLRYDEVNIFTDESVVVTSNERLAHDENSLFGKIFDNRRIGYARSFFIHYFDNLTPNFLFIKGDGNPKFSTQDVGELYLIELPLLAVGAYMLFIFFRPETLLLIFWLATAIIPAAVARETPHALRILNSLPTWHIFIAFGILVILQWVFKKRGKRFFVAAFAGLYCISVGYYLHNYYVHYPRLYSGEWQYGYKQALEYMKRIENKYQNVYISEIIGRAYMYTLFYTKYDPATFEAEKKSYFDSAGFYHVDSFGKFHIETTQPTKLAANTLYIFPPSQAPKGARMLDTINLLNGDPVLSVFDKP